MKPYPALALPLALVAGAAVLSCAARLAAQDSSAVFSDVIDVRVINVEVVVTDKSGELITGLSRDDFEVFEDGEPVELVNFYAIDESTADLGQGAVTGQGSVTGQAAAPPGLPTGATQGLNLVVFIDNVHIQPQNRKLLFDKLRRRLQESDITGSRIMLAAMNNRAEVMQPFTDDLDQIFAALDVLQKQNSINALVEGDRRMFMSRLARASTYSYRCLSNRPPTAQTPTDPIFDSAIREAQSLAITLRHIAEQRYQVSRSAVSALQAFSDTLGGLPGRKAVLYLSDGIPIRPGDSASEAWIAKFDQWYQQNENAIRNCSRFPEAIGDLQRALTGSSSSNFDLHSEITLLTQKASDNRVAFYPVSNGGRGSSFVSAANPGSSDGTSSIMMRNAMIADRMSRDASLLQMADDTGGQAFTGNANIGELFDRARRDSNNFYSLGYAPPERESDNKFHKIKIKVRRKGVKVRHVSGYQDKSWRDRLGDMTIAAALYDLEANPLGIQLQAGEITRQGSRFKVPVMVQIPFREIALLDDGEKAEAKLSLLVLVRNDRGGFSQPRRFDLPISIPSTQVAQARGQTAAYPLELEMKKGDERVAIGVRDHIGQTSSCLKLDFDTGSSEPPKKGKKAKKKKRSKETA